MTKVHKKAWPGKVLGEVISFIEREHGCIPSLETIAEKTGLSTAVISAMFMRDDMKLSRAEYIASCYGYELKLFFPIKEYPLGWEVHAAKRNFPNAGNLSGLARYLHDSNITVFNMSKRIGRNIMMLTNALTKGDIFLSNLEQITENLNIKVLWIYEKKNSC